MSEMLQLFFSSTVELAIKNKSTPTMVVSVSEHAHLFNYILWFSYVFYFISLVVSIIIS